jgi:tRNA (guanine-N7-)-methyltransferase
VRKRNPATPAPGQPEPLLEAGSQAPDWKAVFGRETPLEVDIGFGKGEFLLELSVRRPEVDYVGLEYSRKRVLKLRDKLVRLDRRNVRLVLGDAAFLVPLLFASGSVQAFTINFPDPWPKRRHQKRRLVTRVFGERLAGALAAGGTLTLATDFRPYAEQMLEELTGVPGLVPEFGAGFAQSPPDRVETLYERKFREEGRTNHYLRFRRKDRPATRGSLARAPSDFG